MLRKIIVILLLGLYLVFLFLPGWPLLNYYFFSTQNQEFAFEQGLHYQNNETTHVGDGVYLKALMKRVQGDEVAKNAQNPPPRVNTEIGNTIYIPAEFLRNYAHLSGVTIHFAVFSEKIINRYTMVLLPPPNLSNSFS